MKRITLPARALFMALLFWAVLPGYANNIAWTNTAGGNWSGVSNWNPNEVPGVSDTAIITNGGIYGSLMSTPILNAPQSGILGMHKIQERPVAVDGKIEIRPMMYLALSYDHRIVDGKEAVTFLVRVKESLEDPERLVLDL